MIQVSGIALDSCRRYQLPMTYALLCTLKSILCRVTYALPWAPPSNQRPLRYSQVLGLCICKHSSLLFAREGSSGVTESSSKTSGLIKSGSSACITCSQRTLLPCLLKHPLGWTFCMGLFTHLNVPSALSPGTRKLALSVQHWWALRRHSVIKHKLN